MNRRPPGPPSRRPSAPRVPKRSREELLAQRPLDLGDPGRIPTVEVRAPTFHPFLYRKRLGQFPERAAPGDVVRLTLTDGSHFGWGLFNPHAEIAVRTLTNAIEPPDAAWWASRLSRAVGLRREILRLDDGSDAYRIIHAEGDSLSGLVVDKLGDVLVVEAFALGMFQRAEALLDILNPLCGTQHAVLRTAPLSDEHEGFTADPTGSEALPNRTTVTEFGTQFRVEFAGGHKTGFYCDQRDNRRRFAALCGGKTVLDVCAYTGGFAVQAKRLGEAAEVTGVELDEATVGIAKENARLNKAKVQFVQGDAFPYLRDMLRNGRTYDRIVLDPPKLIFSRDDADISEGKRKYFDLNRLALQLVSPGGVLLSCSCSGLLSSDELFRILAAAASDVRRKIQVFAHHGAAADHPVAGNCPESEYLKTIWLRVE
ncbi:MAG TPA: class I SAM-dependent rRNA methyltransferase [Planctomycetaceae bacterium]|nr:class I SAM-dependent rRNA methyltransferase [Planctomycetaceae bacterium]